MMRKFSFAVLILSFFFLLNALVGIPNIHAAYATGCIPTPPEEWIRLGVYPLPDDENGCREVRASGPRSVSAGMASTSLPTVKVWDDLPLSADIPMSDVKDQLRLGTCSIFAIAACIESLFGIKISEAELYMRVKTQGGSDRTKEGTALGAYVNLLREGVVLDSKFFPYACYDTYVAHRKADIERRCTALKEEIDDPLGAMLAEAFMRVLSHPLTSSAIYKPSIEDFSAWSERQGHPTPKDLKPSWKEETYRVRVDDDVPGIVRALWWLNPIATIGRTVFDDHHSALQHVETRTRIVLDPTSYHRLPLKMYTLKAYDPTHPSGDKLYRLKHALANGFRVVLSIQTFAKYKRNTDGTYAINRRGNKIVEKQWLVEDATPKNRYVIGLPPVAKAVSLPGSDEYEVEGAHAICVCAYDDRDARKAIRFKNSWGTTYADHGYAWLSYDYLQQPGYLLDGWVLKKEGR